MIKNLNPLIFLRLGLGLTYLYSGYDLFFNPQHWYGFVPSALYKLFTTLPAIDNYLKFQGLAELAIGTLFLCLFNKTWTVKIASVLTTVEMVLILLFVGIDPITFRDIGLLGGALTLLFISFKKDRGSER